MGVQLIFVVETDKKCQSDWIYIKELIGKFYSYDDAHVKLQPVYMGGKSRFAEKEKEIKDLRKKFNSASKDNQTIVIYCFDCDEYDNSQECANFLDTVKKYCEKKEYKFVWFCKDIERVFIKEKVPDGQKKKKAAQFKGQKKIKDVKEQDFNASSYGSNKSNILRVLDGLIPVLVRK